MSIGERITELRKSKNMSQGQLAQALNISRQAVSKWENGLAVPDTVRMIQLADILDTDIEYLTSGRQVVPSRPPVVIKTTETVEPVVQVVEKVVERRVEVPVEVPVVQYVEKPVIRQVVRTKYLRNPLEFALVGVACFVIGIIFGLLF